MNIMKVFLACLGTESNTFSPFKTTLKDFEEQGIYHGRNGTGQKTAWAKVGDLWKKLSEDQGWQVVESLSAFATPGGITEKQVYQDFREEILIDLQQNLPFDLVLLNLHGAMVAEEYPDCEGDLLEKIRSIVGNNTIIAAEVDLHCHFTQKMLKNSDIIKSYKEYPHSDIADTAFQLFESCKILISSELPATTAIFNPKMLGLIPTTTPIAKKFVKEMRRAELDERILAVNFSHGFHYGDVPEMGSIIWVTTIDDFELAQSKAEEFGSKVYNLRYEIFNKYLSVNEFVKDCSRISEKPKIYADVADNAGGGATSDTTFLLEALISNNIQNSTIGMINDPETVEKAMQIGEENKADFIIGAKMMENTGNQIKISATITKIVPDFYLDFQQAGISILFPAGTLVNLHYKGIDILVNSIRCQVFTPEPYKAVGLDLSKKNVIILKSAQHFFKKFKKISPDISYVATPGNFSPIVTNLKFEFADTSIYPWIKDPLNRDGGK